MKRVFVPIALLAAALTGLVWWISRDAPSLSPTTTPASPAPAPEPRPTEAPPPVLVTSTPRPADRAPRAERPQAYAVGDVIVRDHRGPDAAPLTGPIEVKPPIGHLLRNETALRTVNELRGRAQSCLRDHPTGPQQLSVTMTVEVKNSSLTVTGVEGATSGAALPVAEPTMACLRSQMIGARVDAAGEEDVGSYPITTVYSSR